MWHYYGGAKNYEEESGWTGNIYHPNPGSYAPPTFAQSDAYYGTHARISGWSVMDSITTGNEKLNILVGLMVSLSLRIPIDLMVLTINKPAIIMTYLRALALTTLLIRV